MSLHKQLWISILAMMSAAFIGSFFVSSLSAKYYLEEQLFRSNIDNVTSIALSLSQTADDHMTSELVINSQFDIGHYQFIKLDFVDGSSINVEADNSDFKEAPKWLMKLFPISIQPGIAQVNDGWKQIGTLSLSSQTRFGYKQLWNNTKRLTYYFLAVSVLCGIIGSLLLKIIIRPLNRTVEHAQAIGERRFITTQEPRTTEFKEVVRSMNKLSAHVRKMLDDESKKLDSWRKDMQHDTITGILNREPVLGHLRAYLQNDDDSAYGALITIRISDLFSLNKTEGRQTMDAMLKRFGAVLQRECEDRVSGKAVAGRLNGSDFLIIIPGDNVPPESGKEILTMLLQVCRELGLPNVKLLGSCTSYHFGETISTLLTRLDSVLESAGNNDTDSCIYVPSRVVSENERTEKVDWNGLLQSALNDKRLTLERFPVVSISNRLMHYETPARLQSENGQLLMAGEFMPHISRLGLAPQLDLVVVELALDMIEKQGEHIGINLSAGLLSDLGAIRQLVDMLERFGNKVELLWLEVPEFGVFQNLERFRYLCQLLKPLRCVIGIEHVSQEVTRIGELHDLGLDYVKIDRSLIHDIDTSVPYQVFLRGFCTILHSIGLKAIAEGVTTEAEWEALKKLGIDGGTGTFFPKDFKE
ncbi:bifunctional diguanylate cyclase/phosphodiesterase [Ketobacter sp.]